MSNAVINEFNNYLGWAEFALPPKTNKKQDP